MAVTVTETETLGLLRDVIATVDPSPQSPLTNVWAFPEDQADIALPPDVAFPFGIVMKALDQEQRWNVQTSGRQSRTAHLWTAEVLLFLDYGPPETSEDMADYLEKAEPWLHAVSDVLMANRNLGSEYILLGSWDGRSGDVMIPLQGGIFWEDVHFSGFRILVPVRHRHQQETTP